MHRPDHDSAVAVRPATAAPGTPGWFQDGNPAEGIRGTVLESDFLNDLLANCLAVCAAGGVSPVKGDDNNLRDAILAMIAAGTVPVGSIMAFPASAPPSGWLKLNGVLLSRTTYANLWAYAQASGNVFSDAVWSSDQRPGSFSTGDGSTTFRIPDFRGLFMRAHHDGSAAYESDTGVPLGRFRDSRNKAHTHTFNTNGHGNGNSSNYHLGGSEYSVPTVVTTSSDGGTEAYPRHASSLFCIKY